MAPHPLPYPLTLGFLDGAVATPIVPAAAPRALRSSWEAIAALGGLIWAAFAYRRAFKRAATHAEGDLFDSPVLWADISARAWDQARHSSDRAGPWRVAIGAGTLIGALAFCAALVQILM
jgi:hypothetical protein